MRRDPPIKQSVKAKSTSWRVAAEWREASTKDAGWREEDMEAGRSGRMAGGGSFGEKRHGLISGDKGREACYACGRQSWLAKSVGSAKVIRSVS